METITFDELLRAVEEAGGGGGEGFTTAELAAAKSVSTATARGWIKRAIALRMVRPARKVVTDMAGRMMPVASYVVVKRRKE